MLRFTSRITKCHKNITFHLKAVYFLFVVRSRCRKACSSVQPVAVLKKTVPILSWLPEYSWKKSIVNDIISGITVAIMHIPQVSRLLLRKAFYARPMTISICFEVYKIP